MKRIFCILLCAVILLAGNTGVTWAGTDSGADFHESGSTGTGTDDGAGASANAGTGIDAGTDSVMDTSFSIDTENKYDGMASTYKEGYIPTITDNKAVVVLPVVADGQIKDNRLTAKVDYEAQQDIPFKHKNYEKVFAYDNVLKIYYIRFDLELIKDRKNGTYPVNISISAKDKKNNKINQIFTVYVLIEDGEAQKEQTDTESENITTKYLSIETSRKYSSMEQPYKNGYSPKIKNNRVKIILPLIASEKLKGNQLTAAVDFGTTENSPFVYKNYEKTFPCGKDGVYCVEFTLNMLKTRYNGIYPVTVNVSAKTEKGIEVAQTFTIYVAVTDGKQPDSDTAEGNTTEQKPTSEPVVLVDSYEFDKEKLNSGDEFGVTIRLKNNSTNKSVQNMVVALDYDAQQFLCLDDSESMYIAKLAKGNTKEIHFTFQINKNTPDGNYKIGLAMSYDDSEANTLTSNGVIMIPVRQESKVQMTPPQIAGNVYAGDTLPLDFQVMNLGRSTVYNVRCDIKGQGLLATSTAFIGNLEAGTEGTAIMNLFISTRDQTEGSTSTEKYGKTEGTITLTYEDADGKQYTSESTFSTNIQEPQVPVIVKEEPKPAGQWWISIAIVSAIILLIVFGAGLYQIRKRKGNEKL